MHEHIGLHQAFQHFSIFSSRHSIFHHKKTKQSIVKVTEEEKKKSSSSSSNEIDLMIEDDDDSKISHEEFSTTTPFTSRSNSNISIHSLLEDQDDFFSSTTTDKEDNKEPWKLSISPNGHIQQINCDYFYIDRQDMTKTNEVVGEERDSYGFKRPTQWISIDHLHQFDLYYKPMLDEQQKNWKENMMFGCGATQKQAYPSSDSLKLKEWVRKGIPSKYRGKMWLHYSGAQSKMESNPGLYQSLVKTSFLMGQENNDYFEIIERDLHRTFPDHLKFASGPYSTQSDTMKPTDQLLSLQRVLLAFSIHSPDIGYCQSLNYLAGFFLLFLEEEEEAFWMLVTTVHEFMPNKMYDVTMEGANLDQDVLLMCIKEYFDEDVWSKLLVDDRHDELPPVTLVTNHWFLTMFINILPVETVLRIWDCFFIEGYKVLFQVALTIIYMNKNKISTMQDPIEIFQILQNMPRRLIDCPTFMNYVFSNQNLFVHLTQSQIDEKREICIKERQQQKNC